jgi:hypothetical protein
MSLLIVAFAFLERRFFLNAAGGWPVEGSSRPMMA